MSTSAARERRGNEFEKFVKDQKAAVDQAWAEALERKRLQDEEQRKRDEQAEEVIKEEMRRRGIRV